MDRLCRPQKRVEYGEPPGAGPFMHNVFVVVTNGPLKGSRYSVSADSPVLIGRSSRASIRLCDDASVSKKHALIYWRENACHLDDLGSTNGTYLNEQRISGARKIENGDIIRLGKTEMALFVQNAER